MENERELLDSIERYVFEENKIVTYKWLSKHHHVHTNVSKRLLTDFINKSNEKVAACYMIGGFMPDGAYKVVVGWQQELLNIKQAFKNITSEHVYSVHKNATDSDLKVLLYTVDSDTTESNESYQSYSSIKVDGNVLRNTNDVAELKRNALIAAKDKSCEAATKKSSVATKQTNGVQKESGPKSNTANDTTNGSKKTESSSPKKTIFGSPKKTISSSPKKTSIAAMFAAQKETKKTENKEKVVQPQPVKNKPKGLSAFFSQSNGVKKPDRANDSDDKVKNVSPEKIAENKATVEAVGKPSEKTVKYKDDTNSKTKTSSKSKAKKSGNKRKRKEEDNASSKKRKRIVMISDSESSDEEGYRSPSPEQREKTPPPPVSDDEDIVPTTPQVGKKAKKKKLVEKTFLDNDGFLVTNKEYALVSDSEEENVEPKETTEKSAAENEKPVKAVVKVEEQKKKSSPQKAKQSSITNFFKKS